MAFVTIDSNGKVTGQFARPQPDLDGFAEIEDSDIRLQPIVKTKSQLKLAELQILAKEFKANQGILNVAWLAAAVADGVNEVTRKDQVTADIAELQIEYDAAVAAVKAKYL